MSTTLIGLKIGSNNTCIYKLDCGCVLLEPSMIAISKNLKNKEVKAVGYEAKKMIGRTPENVSLFSPISNGIIQYEELTSIMIKEFLKKIFPIRKFNQKIKALLLVPECSNYNERKQFENCCFKAGINEVVMIPEVLCLNLGNKLTIQKETARLYVNIGSDQTSIAIVSNNSIVSAYSISIGGSIINIAIKKYIEEKYFLKIYTQQAEFIKNEIVALLENHNGSLAIIGINVKNQQKEQIIITSNELYQLVSYYYKKISETIKSILSTANHITISDISKNGIYFCGGGTIVTGLDIFMFKETGFMSHIIDNHEFESYGISKLMKSPQLLKNIVN